MTSCCGEERGEVQTTPSGKKPDLFRGKPACRVLIAGGDRQVGFKNLRPFSTTLAANRFFEPLTTA